jgi:hypothetical protein
VRMDGQLRPPLRERFTPITDRLHGAYGGVWRYLIFVGVAAGPTRDSNEGALQSSRDVCKGPRFTERQETDSMKR